MMCRTCFKGKSLLKKNVKNLFCSLITTQVFFYFRDEGTTTLGSTPLDRRIVQSINR